jgi:hypothetical protein
MHAAFGTVRHTRANCLTTPESGASVQMADRRNARGTVSRFIEAVLVRPTFDVDGRLSIRKTSF